MAGDPRPPGYISGIAKVFGTKATYWTPSVVSGSYTQNRFKSYRPSYLKGSVVTLTGGTKFRKATPYSHTSVELGNFTDYFISGYALPALTPANYRGAQDGGREVGYLVDAGFQPLVGGTVGSPTMPTEMRNESVTKALLKLGDQKVNLGENLATLGMTVRLLHNKSSILLDALKAARNREFQKHLRHSFRDLLRFGVSRRIANEYLEYVYGIKPLVEDVHSVVELMKKQTVQSLLLRASGTSQRTYYKGASSSFTNLSYSKFKRLEQTSDVLVKTVLHAQIDPNYSGIRAANQLGLSNPLGLAWDLVPYSFVVDWFLPIGSVLYALSAPAGLIFVDGSTSMRVSESASFDWKAAGLAVSQCVYSVTERPMTVPVTYEGYTRVTHASWPLPGLWFDPDPFRADRSLKALALAIAAFSKSRPDIR